VRQSEGLRRVAALSWTNTVEGNREEYNVKWDGVIVAIVEGKGKFAGRNIYLIKCKDGDRIWRFEDEMQKEIEVDNSKILNLPMVEG